VLVKLYVLMGAVMELGRLWAQSSYAFEYRGVALTLILKTVISDVV
jgi:hypothetical protein